ncbi:MAG: SDR family NAD(P)-dependent oxidoreductase [Chitinispirillales bacterium]|jgi:short-subunit dehydrogenase|nr:SDR family NAD(P)-dependent oxidoreductase [Chitinispirillales bacterium]
MKCAVITGASSGIGLECAKIVSRNRLFGVDKIFLLARRKENMENLSKELEIETQIVVCDVSRDEGIKNFAEILNVQNPDITLLINSAGFGKNGDFTDISVCGNIGMIDVNCRGLVYMTQICLNYMKSGAHILNVSSVAGFAPLAKFTVYGATKAFVTSFSVGLSVELEKRNISVTICAPGSVDTEFHKIARGDSGIVKKLYSSKAPVKKVAELALEDTAKKKLFSSYGFPAKIARLFGGAVPKKSFAKFSYKNIYA